MNDGKNTEMTATEEMGTDAAELIELGSVSEETKGSWVGAFSDGWDGRWSP